MTDVLAQVVDRDVPAGRDQLLDGLDGCLLDAPGTNFVTSERVRREPLTVRSIRAEREAASSAGRSGLVRVRLMGFSSVVEGI